MSTETMFDVFQKQLDEMRHHFQVKNVPVPAAPKKRWTQGPCYAPDASDQLQKLAQAYDNFRLVPATPDAPNPRVLGSMKDKAAMSQVGLYPDDPGGPDRWFFQAWFYGDPRPEFFSFGAPQNIVP